ncbi:helix-turn-helix domain-containing protein [Salmonella enterica subsp. enterica serovar Give]|uniref:Helix-turn-helix domain-containing protein n=3 Tax=Salmonella enterica TaxID=28901 RepID=A0A744BZ60_SALER|nr:YdaS family helix-turn-helix protein [Salmonella enterica]EAA4605666.1 helix-turn-helix domain-containing protein [Salmonella enterica subsp. enterica serovar Kisangani]EAA6519782.1 helix-turn-helix domain-containing protein [Salmonella enterica subsp. enterica serovar Muenster]EAA7254618.1 helix-turn-helix domain-containing protein [Salmonella enterica subsp. enterica serovar Newport]EAB6122467.1 helix-turn-helix domain-containing protein [Salmonella enterica subsp. enterica serovar Braende
MTLDEYLKKNRVRQSCLATLAGCSQSMISLVTTGRSQLSPEKVLRIAEATNFEVTPHELRPDIYPNPTDGLPVGDKANTQTAPEMIHENQA